MRCIYCQNKKTYLPNNGQVKCAVCKRKYSPKKLARQAHITEAFLDNCSATQCAKELHLHYNTVQNYYMHLRKAITLYADARYQENTHLVNEFDEYLYLPKSITHFDDNIHKMEHFITFAYHDRVYNIMMPTIERYELDMDSKSEKKKLSKFLRFNKVSKLQNAQNPITRFWDFFEDFILLYKGISKEQFIYYLKEAEFRFNYSEEEQKEILSSMNEYNDEF